MVVQDVALEVHGYPVRRAFAVEVAAGEGAVAFLDAVVDEGVEGGHFVWSEVGCV